MSSLPDVVVSDPWLKKYFNNISHPDKFHRLQSEVISNRDESDKAMVGDAPHALTSVYGWEHAEEVVANRV
ncbi:hypothetical protein GIB67_013873 [Kingdonia uniflora]|uniref:Uncharacterized protein n=1 Tax=Kingdonia uniflora TaxID=39325 RepID=A0A7J7LDG7_9MAGN|nr:hypothetical protein GIB67_013873 [Kingdonia uniflora]